MYATKSAGTGRIAWFEPAMLEELLGRIELERDVRAALEHAELDVHFQPIVALVYVRCSAPRPWFVGRAP